MFESLHFNKRVIDKGLFAVGNPGRFDLGNIIMELSESDAFYQNIHYNDSCLLFFLYQ